MANYLRRWAFLRPEIRGDGLWIGYRDDRGRSRPVPEPSGTLPDDWLEQPYGAAPSPEENPFWDSFSPLYIPMDLPDLLESSRSSLPDWEFGPHATGPVTLPVFIGYPRGLQLLPWLALVHSLLGQLGLDGERYQLARSDRFRWAPRERFELPFEFCTLGPDSQNAGERLCNVEWTWYGGETAVRRFGIRFHKIEPAAIDGGLQDGPGCDILLCDSSLAHRAFAAIRRMARQALRHPRLTVILDREAEFGRGPPHLGPPGLPGRAFEIQLRTAGLDLPAGASLLWVPLDLGFDGTDYVKAFSEGLIHDFPLHQATKAAQRLAGHQTRRPPILISDPAANHDLRIADAALAILERAMALQETLSIGDVQQFLTRTVSPPSILAKVLAQAGATVRTFSGDLDQALYSVADFSQESHGLVPLAVARDRLEEAVDMGSELEGTLAEIADDPQSREAIAQHQTRCADVQLLRREPDPGQSFFVEAPESLAEGAHYDIRFHIGRRGMASLVVDQVPPIDPLLPEPDPEKGHLLHIAVYGLDFKVRGPILKPLLLPPLGGSQPVTFPIVAPPRLGPARLRICVYYDLDPDDAAEERPNRYRNHLIQSFLLETEITAGEEWRPSDTTTVTLEFSRTSRFANLKSLAPRALSLVLNQDRGGESHTLSIKRGGVAGAINFTEKIIGNALTEVREHLRQYTWNDAGTGPRFPESMPADQRAVEFDSFVSALARIGGRLYSGIFGRTSSDLLDALWELPDHTDDVIQIARLDQTYLFPWTALYDFALPPEITGVPEPAVCHGYLRNAADGTPFSCKACLANCLHPDKRETFCVYGFWGMRHQVEQLLHTPSQAEDPITDIKPVRDGAIRVAVGLEGGSIQSLSGELAASLGARWVRRLEATDDLLQVLWDDRDRPAILLLVGHYETADIVGEPQGPRVTLPGRNWLRPEDILARLQQERRRFQAPHPVVLLAACESAAADLSTLTGFVNAFATTRVAAVVGTETTIFEGIAHRFGRQLAADLFTQKPFGKAVLDFRRTMLRENNPLGFVFTPYGDAELARDRTAG